MKKKELQELRAKEPKELETMAAKKKEEVESVLIDTRAGKVKNVHTAKSLRRDIAQILTELNQGRARI